MKYFFFFLFSSTVLLAQSKIDDDNNYIKNRRGQLFFKGEIEHRITPIYSLNTSQFSNNQGNLSKAEQNNGTGLNYSLNYFITKNFSVNFGQTFRYAMVLYPDTYPEISSTSLSEKALHIDYHFSVDYFLKVFNRGQFYFRLGFSINNTGTEYAVTERNQQFNFWIVRPYNTRYFANNFAIGYKIKKTDISLGVYQTNYTEYEPESIQTLFPYVKISYDIFKF